MSEPMVGILMACAVLAAPNAVLLEVHVGARAERASAAFTEVARELGRIVKLEDRSATGKRLEATIGPRAISLDAEQKATLRRQAQAGIDAYADGKIPEAVRLLGELRERFPTVAGGDEQDSQFRALLLRAMLALALAHGRAGDSLRGDEVARFAARHLPDQEVSRKLQGAEAVELLTRARKQLTARGGLRVDAGRPGAAVLIGGRYAGVTPLTLSDLAAGEQFIEVRGASERGRVHRVTIPERAQLELLVDPDLEGALSSHGEAALVVRSLPDRAVIARMAARLGSTLGAEEVYVIGLRNEAGRDTIWAVRVLPATGQLDRASAIPAPASALPAGGAARLARAIALGSEPTLIDDALTPMAGQQDPWWHDRWGWALTGTGAALAGGSLLILGHAGGLRDEARSVDIAQRGRLVDEAGTWDKVAYAMLALQTVVEQSHH
jgi:hypothetical protein